MDPSILERIYKIPGRATRAIVDLDAIEANVAAVRAIAGSATSVMAVVKANAYGHGAIAVARSARRAGAAYLAVATVEEGAQLRRAGIDAPILVLGPLDFSEISRAIECRLELAVGDRQLAGAIATVAAQVPSASPVAIHLKIDTGMHRFGAAPDDAVPVAGFISAQPALRLRGIFSHFACADEPDLEPTHAQARRFAAVIEELAALGIHPELTHTANSAATLRSATCGDHLVRLGIGLYGLNPSRTVTISAAMRPAMTIVSRITRIHTLRTGEAVSYGATYRAVEPERLALVPIGYADGYRRALSNRGEMLVRGAICPVRGRVCMDQTIVGIPADCPAELHDYVIVGGGWADAGVPSFDRMACWAETINYEMAAGIATRVPRFYARSGMVIAIEDLSGYHERS